MKHWGSSQGKQIQFISSAFFEDQQCTFSVAQFPGWFQHNYYSKFWFFFLCRKTKFRLFMWNIFPSPRISPIKSTKKLNAHLWFLWDKHSAKIKSNVSSVLQNVNQTQLLNSFSKSLPFHSHLLISKNESYNIDHVTQALHVTVYLPIYQWQYLK